MSTGRRYDEIVAEYGWAAVRGMVFGLHVHVAVGGADRTLAVYNAIRSHLPEIAALAGNAPFYDGADTGLASVRPKIAEGFPRQGVPPPIPDWESYAELLAWGRRGGSIPDAKHLWWELRLHPVHGTLELRAPDMPSTTRDTLAIAGVFQALAAWLADRYDAEGALPTVSQVRIEENRWLALRHGLTGDLVDYETGEPHWTRGRISRMLDQITPAAERLGAGGAVADARELLQCNGTERQRVVAAEHGLPGLVAWLVERFRVG
jgi:carboxylate-amine ligase